jgi:8-oxo-dGTP pyrophosphatase MutT (NUDIX family)
MMSWLLSHGGEPLARQDGHDRVTRATCRASTNVTHQSDNAAMNIRWKPSVTVAALMERDGKFLLIEEHTDTGLKLNNPAGHLEPGESPAYGCAREALEETAHHFTPTALVGVYLSRFRKSSTGEDITYLRFAFCGEVGELVPDMALDEGIVRAIWMSAEEIRASADKHRSPLLLKCLDDYLAGRRYPLDAVYTDVSVLSEP